MAALLLAVAGADGAAAARVARCLSFDDRAGDAAAGGTGQAPDQSLDLTRVRIEVARGRVTAHVKVVRLADVPEKAWGDRFQVGFTVDDTMVDFYYKRSRTRDVEGLVIYQRGLRVNRTLKSEDVAATYNAATGTVSLSVQLRTLSSALGKHVAGRAVTGVHVTAFGSYVVENVDWDRAETTASLRLVDCR